MARTVIGRGSTYAPESSAKWFIITATPSVAPDRTSLDATTTLDVTAAVADSSGFETGMNTVQDSEWGSAGIPFTSLTGKTVGTPQLEFWADRGGDDIVGEMDEGDEVAVVYLPHGDTPTELAEVWLLVVGNIDLTKSKGAHARRRVMFTVQDLDPTFTIPAAA